MTPTPPGWYPDPWRLAPLRWWDSQQWTPYVAPGEPSRLVGQPAAVARRANPVLPLRAAGVAVAGLALLLGALRPLLSVVRGGGAPNLAAAMLVTAVQYVAMAGICVAVCRRWSSGQPRADLGLCAQPVDLAWGTLGWVVALFGAGSIAVLVRALGVPFTSNNPFASGRGSGLRLADGPGLTFLGFVIIVCAPFFEELLFRGVVLRALRSQLSAPVAIAVQGALFGAFHFDPSRGWGNIGLLIVLTGMGIVLGTLAERTGRLAPGMVAHGLQNALAFGLGLLLVGSS